MTANEPREISPSVAGVTTIDPSRICAAIPLLVAAGSGNFNDIIVGASAKSVVNFKLQSTKTQALYVRIYYLYK